MTAHAWLSSPLYLGSLLCCVVGGALSLKRQPQRHDGTAAEPHHRRGNQQRHQGDNPLAQRGV
jgi:hypothetical protein